MSPALPDTALVVSAHGSPDSLDELPEFLANIRRGRPATSEIVAEVRRRYEAIGGRSPLMAVTRAQAAGLARRLAMPAYVAMRLWHPYPRELVPQLVAAGVKRAVSVPIAPYSVHVYHAALREAVAEAGAPLALVEIPAWNVEPALVRALAADVDAALAAAPAGARTLLVLSAHSLPTRVVAAGDPYPALVEATARAVVAALAPRADGAAPVAHRLVYQSQGMSAEAWLGPDLPAALDAARDEGFAHVVVAPIGFLSDHIEILYDLDIEAVALARARGLTLSRTRTLNDGPGLLDALEATVRRALATAPG